MHFRSFLVSLKLKVQVFNVLVDRGVILTGLAKLGNYRLSQMFDFGKMPNVLLAFLLLFKRSQWSFGRSDEKCFMNRVLAFLGKEIKLILYPKTCLVYKYISFILSCRCSHKVHYEEIASVIAIPFLSRHFSNV